MPFLKFLLVDFQFTSLLPQDIYAVISGFLGGASGGAKIILEVGGMVQQLRAHTTLLENPSSSPRNHVA